MTLPSLRATVERLERQIERLTQDRDDDPALRRRLEAALQRLAPPPLLPPTSPTPLGDPAA